MLETNTKKWEKAVLEKGIGIGVEKGVEKTYAELTEKMIANGMSNAAIRKITGLPLSKINDIRKRMNKLN